MSEKERSKALEKAKEKVLTDEDAMSAISRAVMTALLVVGVVISVLVGIWVAILVAPVTAFWSGYLQAKWEIAQAAKE